MSVWIVCILIAKVRCLRSVRVFVYVPKLLFKFSYILVHNKQYCSKAWMFKIVCKLKPDDGILRETDWFYNKLAILNVVNWYKMQPVYKMWPRLLKNNALKFLIIFDTSGFKQVSSKPVLSKNFLLSLKVFPSK